MEEGLRPVGTEFVKFICPDLDNDPSVTMERYGHYEVFVVVKHENVPRCTRDTNPPLREVIDHIRSIKETREEFVERMNFELHLSELRKEFFKKRERKHEINR